MTQASESERDWPFWVAAVLLFAGAASTLVWAIATHGLGHISVVEGGAFTAFMLATIFCGFPHPYYGHVSFDRVAQLSALLIFGPIAAALMAFTTSLIFPWHRLLKGHTIPQALVACLANAGMMTFVLLASGGLYLLSGGTVPLMEFGPTTLVPLLVLAATAHLLNEAFMATLLFLRGGELRRLFNSFTTVIELGAILIAFTVAICYSVLPISEFMLVLTVLGLSMLVVRRLALLQHDLESRVVERTRALKAQAQELDRLVMEDTLTGLPNRRYIGERLPSEIRRAQRYDRPLSVALADVDHFKQVNDLHSHRVGDVVLHRIARVLQKYCRETDVVARYGGEEFVLIFTETEPALATALCERLRAAIAIQEMGDLDQDISVTMSIGVTGISPDLNTMEKVLDAADRRLYEAKHRGRNLVVGPTDVGDSERVTVLKPKNQQDS